VNVYPAEIEAELLQHDAIKDVAVIGVADEKWVKFRLRSSCCKRNPDHRR